MKAGHEPRTTNVLVQVEYRGKGPHEAAREGCRLLGERHDLDSLDRLGLTYLIETVVTARHHP